MLRGIDVSQYQGEVPWPQVATSGVAYAMIRVADGDYLRDPRAAANLSGARAADLVVGSYAVVRPSAVSDPAAQARTHYGAVQAAGGLLWGDLPHAIDFEEDNGLGPAQLADWLERHCAEWERLMGCPALLYTFPSWWAPLAAIAGPATARTRLWWASYGADTGKLPTAFAPPNPVPLPWGKCKFWQYTSRGNLADLATGHPVDGDVYDGTLNELRAGCLSAQMAGLEAMLVTPETTPDDPPTEAA